MKSAVLVSVIFAGAALAAPVQEFSTSAGTIKVTPIQHASLMIEAGGKVLYIDPAQGSFDKLPPADYILITDIHGDHMAPDIVSKLKKSGTGTEVVAPEAVARQVFGSNIISYGQMKTLGPFTVEAVPAYNLTRGPSAGKLFHDKGRGCGYIVAYGGKRFYFSGDTEGIPEMKALKNIDVAFVCMNLPYTMTPEEAADAVRAFHPAIVYPYHYKGSDTMAFKKALDGSGIDVRLLDWYGS
jgi:L-ascorbate metabolism protein UlaG (beta-lactamase superfamily)